MTTKAPPCELHEEEELPSGVEPNEAETPAPEEAKTPEELLAEAQSQINELKDKYLRQIAEFDNFRKRTIKEKADLILSGGEKVMLSLLPVFDDLMRAEESIAKSKDLDTLKEGVELIAQKLFKALQSQGLKIIDTIGEDFNTDFHEAIALIPATDEGQKGKIIDCVQQGYLLGEKVLRHAKVVVGQ